MRILCGAQEGKPQEIYSLTYDGQIPEILSQLSIPFNIATGGAEELFEVSIGRPENQDCSLHVTLC